MKVQDENGNEVDAFTADDVTAMKAENQKAIDEAKAEAVAARTEVENLKRVTNEKTENFKRLNEMSEKEKETYSAKEIENIKRVEAAEAKSKALEDKINGDILNRITSDKEKALLKYHGGNKDLKEALEKNFDMINLVGDTTDIIEERARLAASMMKGSMERNNPLMANLNGAAPSVARKNETEKFMESDKAKAALKLMGEDKK